MTLRLASLFALAVLGCAGATAGGSGPESTTGSSAEENPCANPCGGGGAPAGQAVELGVDVAEWRNWTKANSERFVSGDHQKAWADVYVTPAHAELYKSLTGTMPEGMAMVKAQYASKDASDIKAATVMVKMAEGFDADNGDWYYQVIGKSGNVMIEGKGGQGKTEMCGDCHTGADIDFVFGLGR